MVESALRLPDYSSLCECGHPFGENHRTSGTECSSLGCKCGRFRAAAATFSPCRTWRYSLAREIADPQFGCLDVDERDATVTFVGLNPSTADETTDDPTIRRCVRFAREWGFARLKMVNLFAYRATDPTDLFNAAKVGIDVVGPENDHNISLAFGGSDKIIAAWGAPAPLTIKRVEQFAETFGGWEFWALGLTALGSPRHPLYMRADAQPALYDLGARHAI